MEFVDVNQYPLQITSEVGIIEIRRNLQANAFDISLFPLCKDLYVPKNFCRTTWPLELIKYIAQRVDFAWLCDLIARHEEPGYVVGTLKRQLFSYFSREQFARQRLLDFGCGTGASTLALARMLPDTQIVGVDVNGKRIELANRIKSFTQQSNVSFLCSPASDQLPARLGSFGFVTMCGVYEHLLPEERKVLMPLLWQALKPGGFILLSRTPHRYSPYEAHSTGLWFVNYLPDKAALWTVRKFAHRNLKINHSHDWTVHLRGGLRGGSEREIIRNVTTVKSRSAHIVQPKTDDVCSGTSCSLTPSTQGHPRRRDAG